MHHSNSHPTVTPTEVSLDSMLLPLLLPIGSQLIGCVCQCDPCKWHCASTEIYRVTQQLRGPNEVHDFVLGIQGEILKVQAYTNGFVVVYYEK